MEIATLNTKYLTCSSLKVKVIRIDSPTLFWVQLDNSKEDFKDLMEDLVRRMTRRSRFLHHRVYDVYLDDMVVIQEHRGIILQIRGDGTVSIDLRDWGRLVERRYSEIYILEDRFRELEWQAIPCTIAHTEPFQLRIHPQLRNNSKSPGFTRTGSSAEDHSPPSPSSSPPAPPANQPEVIPPSLRSPSPAFSDALTERIFPNTPTQSSDSSILISPRRSPSPTNSTDSVEFLEKIPPPPPRSYFQILGSDTFDLDVTVEIRKISLCRYLCCITASSDEELSTPVQAEEQWNAYRYLRNLRCVIALEGCQVYQYNNSFIKICNDCYERETVEYKKQFLTVFSHNLTHQNTMCNQTRCTICNKPIACIQSAEDCPSCIESFIHADRAHLDAGWGIPSVSSWTQD
ncbi:hypothetical protein ALC56_05486 [Trachymyrmex septentrionalis]|uniref:Tudor domain-containing protein n=1 Tax=Trachymyrmex septentrionalis TaxID=34720 RepID=A0A151JYA7_9HYME|nr:hypothetical protein ALC56_05486 [Trachymyrmex septentrionalis]